MSPHAFFKRALNSPRTPHLTSTSRTTSPRRSTLVAAIALSGSLLVSFPATAGADGDAPTPSANPTAGAPTETPTETPADSPTESPTESTDPSESPAPEPPYVESPGEPVTQLPDPEPSTPEQPVTEPTPEASEETAPQAQAEPKQKPEKAAADARGRRTTYFISANGADNNNGLTPRTAFRSVDKVRQLQLKPRDRVMLERGSTFAGELQVWQSGRRNARIRVLPYGPESLPAPRVTGECVNVYGSWVAVVGIVADGCRIGVYTNGDNNVLRHVTATHNMHGIEVGEGAVNTRVVRNRLIDNQRMAPNTPGDFDDYGAVGIVVMGDQTEVAHNEISGSVAPSADFGTDGSAVEIYGGRGTRVHHNIGRNNRAFTELGNRRSANTKYFYNVSISSVKYAEFLVTRGTSDYFGPVNGTVARNNTIRHTGVGSQGFWCNGGCNGNVLTLWDNIIDVRGRIGFSDGPLRGGRNIYWGAPVEHRMLPGDQVADPQFRDVRGALYVKATSPAVDRVAHPPMGRDVGGRRVPTDGNGDGRAAADVGAYETARS